MDVQVTPPTGRIEVIAGCMFSGKTSELVRRVQKAQIGDKNILALTPDIDDRYDEDGISSRTGYSISATEVSSDGSDFDDILQSVESSNSESSLYGSSAYPNDKQRVDTVAIDEMNLFDESLFSFVKSLSDMGIRVIIAGLDLNFRGEPFTPSDRVLPLSDHVEKRQAVCEVCGNPATRTQRLVDGEPAHYNDKIIDVGGSEKYEPRCKQCHKVPRN